MPDDKDKVERLTALAEEIEDDDLEAEMAGKSAEERMKIIEREGATHEQTVAARARLRAKMKDKIQEIDKQKAVPASNVVDIRAARRRKVIAHTVSSVLSITAAAAAFLVFLDVKHYMLTPEVDQSTLPVASGDWDEAARYHALAAMAYSAGHFDACVTYLDDARRVEPGIVELGDIRELREQCTKRLPPPGAGR